MRISDWSSDVCSSDLNICLQFVVSGPIGEIGRVDMHPIFADEAVVVEFEEGRARRDDRLALKGAADRPAQAGIGRLAQPDIEGAVIIGAGSESDALDLAFRRAR